MDEQVHRAFFDASVMYLLGQPQPELPPLPGRVHRAPPPADRDTGHPREQSLERALVLAAGIADRRNRGPND